MQGLNDIGKILGDSGMKIISKEIFEKAFAKQQKLISIKNRASNLLLLASTILFSFSSALSFCTVVYVRGILPKENNEVKDNPVAAISSPIAKIEENPDVKILQQEVAPVEVVKPAIKDKSRKKRAKQKVEPITEEPITEEPITEEPITEEPITINERIVLMQKLRQDSTPKSEDNPKSEDKDMGDKIKKSRKVRMWGTYCTIPFFYCDL